jgi:hypothetical protein
MQTVALPPTTTQVPAAPTQRYARHLPRVLLGKETVVELAVGVT